MTSSIYSMSLSSLIMAALIVSILSPMKLNTMILMVLLVTIMMSTSMLMIKPLSIMPFIMLLTMIGGLMIIFLYFTAISSPSSPNHPQLLLKNTLIKLLIMTVLSMFMMYSEKIPYMNNSMDPTIMIFHKSNTQMTMIIIMTLILILYNSIKLCSQMNQPFRQKTKNW